MSSNLDDLISTRFKGADNIRGIRYQILYSIFRAFDLYTNDTNTLSIRLEGLEDVDVGLQLENEYVQVKTAGKPWNWSQLKDPIKGFLQTYRLEPNSRFTLAVNFLLRHEIAHLAGWVTLPNKEKSNIEKKFANLCKQVGGTVAEAQGLVSRLGIKSLTEEDLWSFLRPAVTEAFGLGSEAVDVYIEALTSRFLKWAVSRKTITRADLDEVRADVGEALSRESEFQAYGRSLITRIEWKPDNASDDFFEKGTRSGHIVADLDIRRPTWLKRIQKALDSSNVCILRSSSGQGKSTLMFRFAYDYWPKDHTFVLRTATSTVEAEQVCTFLRNRTSLGRPTLLLVDDAGWNMRNWPRIAQECSVLGIKVLVTARHEDWHRFVREGLTNFEILEPELDLQEAKDIYKALRAHGRLHSSVDSAEWAYEKVGKPHLLIEYVYLLTQGRLLEDRLRDQVKQFSVQQEDPAKIKLLRRATLAHALGTPLEVNQLMHGISFRDDPQQNLRTLADEYLTLSKSLLNGLHWVRSDHLARILHEGYPDMAQTALAILESVPESYLALFVSNAILRLELDTDAFLNGLADKVKSSGLSFLLAALDGIFDAGERQFFGANKALFDEAYDEFGPSGPFFLAWNFMPTVKLNVTDEFAEILGENGGNLRKLSELALQTDSSPKGLDNCASFLRHVVPAVHSDLLRRDVSDTGRLLDWCVMCKISLPVWPKTVDEIISSSTVFDLTLKEFCNFTQGLFRYDEATYLKWFSANHTDILGYLKLHTDCVDIGVESKNISIKFILRNCGNDLGQEMAESRLKKLRAAIPFGEQYNSQGIWIMAFGLAPTWESTNKSFSREHLLFESDTKKNAAWGGIIQNHYIPDSYYRFEESWYELRFNARLFVRGLSSAIVEIDDKKRRKLWEQVVDTFGKLERCTKFIPLLSGKNFEVMGKRLSASLQNLWQYSSAHNQWAISFKNFSEQIIQFFIGISTDKKDGQVGRLAVYYFNEAHSKLEGMHEVFSRFFLEAPDYFNASALNSDELDAYSELADLLEACITEPPLTPQANIRQYVRTRREQRRNHMLDRLRQAVAPLEKEGMSFVFPNDIYVEHPARYLTLAFSVKDVLAAAEPLASVITVLNALIGIVELADFFCLVPIHNGARFLEGGYQFSSHTIPELVQGNCHQWETLVPQELPERVMQCLPPLPLVPCAELQLRSTVQLFIAEIEALAVWEDRIETLALSGNRFERQLYNRHQAQLLDAQRELGAHIKETRERLLDFLPISAGSEESRELLETLKTLQDALRNNDLLFQEPIRLVTE